MKLQVGPVIVVAVLLAVLVAVIVIRGRVMEKMTGFGIISSLRANNPLTVCSPGNEAQGGNWSGGCQVPGVLAI